MSNDTEKARTVLVIDDDPSILKLMEATLKNEGFNVMLAADGVYGMQLIRENAPDLVLLDITMPGPDGFQVVQSIREISSVPIIMVTGTHSTEVTQKCLELGADDYITKPFRPNELVARVRTKLRRT